MADEIKTTAEAVENAALPDAYAVHADPNTPLSAEQKPLPPELAASASEQKSEAQWAYERLVLYIQNFEEQLDGDHEIGMGFAGGEVGIMRIQGIGFFAPDILTFYGADMTGAKTQLVQHVSLHIHRVLPIDLLNNRMCPYVACSVLFVVHGI